MILISHLLLPSGVFTELISEIGVEDVQVEELWSFDLETLKALEYLSSSISSSFEFLFIYSLSF